MNASAVASRTKPSTHGGVHVQMETFTREDAIHAPPSFYVGERDFTPKPDHAESDKDIDLESQKGGAL
jgi:hypothetical protein